MVDPPSASVSVLIPTFNARTFVCRALRSVLGQSIGVHEIIIVDDASSDGTADFIQTMFPAEAYPSISVIRLNTNRGPGHARNVGIERASGDWIALLDADDAWHLSRIERLSPKFGAADIIFDNLLGFDAATGAITKTLFEPFLSEKLSIVELLSLPSGANSYDFGYLHPLIRRAFLYEKGIAYNPKLRSGEDLFLYLEIIYYGGRVCCVNDSTYIYTTPIGMATGAPSQLSRSIPSDLALAEEFKKFFEKENLSLDADSRLALTKRIDHHTASAPRARMRYDWLHGRYRELFRSILRNPVVFSGMLVSRSRNLIRRFGI